MTLENYHCTPQLLSDRSVIACTGADIKAFLQGQISNDINLLETQNCIHTLILTPQGKILADMYIHNFENGYYINIHQSAAEWLIKRFNMYKLRSDIILEDLSDILCVGLGNIEGHDVSASDLDPLAEFRDGKKSYINIFQRKNIKTTATNLHYFTNAMQGIASFGVDYQASEFFPQDLWFDKLGSVSYIKGCYVGQEVVSRMRHKSTPRKRLLPFSSELAFNKGDQIFANGSMIGNVISCHQAHNYHAILVMARMDKITDEATIFSDQQGHVLTLKKPEWMQNHA